MDDFEDYENDPEMYTAIIRSLQDDQKQKPNNRQEEKNNNENRYRNPYQNYNEQRPQNIQRPYYHYRYSNYHRGYPDYNAPAYNRGGRVHNRESDNLNYEQLLELEDRIGNVSKGYSDDEINTIPIMYSFEDNPQQCSVCLENIEDGSPQLSIACRHSFHVECIKKSLTINKSCPICKMDAIDLS